MNTAVEIPTIASTTAPASNIADLKAPTKPKPPTEAVQVFSARIELSPTDPRYQTVADTVVLFNTALTPIVDTLWKIKKGEFAELNYGLNSTTAEEQRLLQGYIDSMLRAEARDGPHLFGKLAPIQKLRSDMSARKVLAKLLKDEFSALLPKKKPVDKSGVSAPQQDLAPVKSQIAQLITDFGEKDLPVQEYAELRQAVLVTAKSIPNAAPETLAAIDRTLLAFDVLMKVREGWKPFEALRVSIGLKGSYEPEVISQAIAHISSHIGLMADWNVRHAEWEQKVAAWLTDTDHPERAQYAAVRNDLRNLDINPTKPWISGFIKYFENHPSLAAWRGGASNVVPLLDADIVAIRNSSQGDWKKIVATTKTAFFDKNPEIAALWKIHVEFRKEFLRPPHLPQSEDGFDSPPTFSLPDAQHHRRYPVLPGPQTGGGYSNVDYDLVVQQIRTENGATAAKPEVCHGKKLYRGTITLSLLTQDSSGLVGPTELALPVSFDERFGAMTPDTASNGSGKYIWSDPHGRFSHKVSLAGARLMLPPHGGPAYLSFTVRREVPDPQKLEFDKVTRKLLSPTACRLAAVVPTPGGLMIVVGERSGDSFTQFEKHRVRCERTVRVPTIPGEFPSKAWNNARDNENEFRQNVFAHIAAEKGKVKGARESSFGIKKIADDTLSSGRREYLDNLQSSLAETAASEALQRILGRFDKFDAARAPALIIYPENLPYIPKDGGRFHDKTAFGRFHTEVGNKLEQICERYGIQFRRQFIPGIYQVDPETGALGVQFGFDQDGATKEVTFADGGRFIVPKTGKVYGSVEQVAAVNLLKNLIDPKHLADFAATQKLNKAERIQVRRKLELEALPLIKVTE